MKDENDWPLDKETIERIDEVIGATNHSFLLRNSEHLIGYVLSGTWNSSQFEKTKYFLKSEEKKTKQKLQKYENKFPNELNPRNKRQQTNEKSLETIFEEDKDNLTFEGVESKDAADAYNILVLGKTGAGKSRIINLLYNQKVCEEGSGEAKSKTRDIEITHSKPLANHRGPNNPYLWPNHDSLY